MQLRITHLLDESCVSCTELGFLFLSRCTMENKQKLKYGVLNWLPLYTIGQNQHRFWGKWTRSLTSLNCRSPSSPRLAMVSRADSAGMINCTRLISSERNKSMDVELGSPPSWAAMEREREWEWERQKRLLIPRINVKTGRKPAYLSAAEIWDLVSI